MSVRKLLGIEEIKKEEEEAAVDKKRERERADERGDVQGKKSGERQNRGREIGFFT